MNYFAGSIFTDTELITLGLYLLTCIAAIVFIILFMIKIVISVIEKNPLNKHHLLFVGLGILALCSANILIDL